MAGNSYAPHAWKGDAPTTAVRAASFSRTPFSAWEWSWPNRGGLVINEIWRGLAQVICLIGTGDPYLFEIVTLSLRVSGTALLFSTLIGIPLGAILGLSRFAGRRLVVALLYTGMGFPPVVVGLFVYLMLSRSGPLGQLNWPVVPS